MFIQIKAKAVNEVDAKRDRGRRWRREVEGSDVSSGSMLIPIILRAL